MFKNYMRQLTDGIRGYGNDMEVPAAVLDARHSATRAADAAERAAGSGDVAAQALDHTASGVRQLFGPARGLMTATTVGQAATTAQALSGARNEARTTAVLESLCDIARSQHNIMYQNAIYGQHPTDRAEAFLCACRQIEEDIQSRLDINASSFRVKVQLVGGHCMDSVNVRHAAEREASLDLFVDCRNPVSSTLQKAIETAHQHIGSPLASKTTDQVIYVFVLIEEVDPRVSVAELHDIQIPHRVAQEPFLIIALGNNRGKNAHAISHRSCIENGIGEWIPFYELDLGPNVEGVTVFEPSPEDGVGRKVERMAGISAASGSLGALAQWGVTYSFAMPHTAGALLLVAPWASFGLAAGAVGCLGYQAVGMWKQRHAAKQSTERTESIKGDN